MAKTASDILLAKIAIADAVLDAVKESNLLRKKRVVRRRRRRKAKAAEGEAKPKRVRKSKRAAKREIPKDAGEGASAEG